jgi:hypothetical protein
VYQFSIAVLCQFTSAGDTLSETNTVHAFITLNLDTGEKAFLDIQELQEWLDKERAAFAWFGNLAGRDGGAARGGTVTQEWLGRVENFIRENNNHQANESHQQNIKNNLKSDADSYFQNRRVRSSEAPDAQFVFQLRDRHSDRIAGYALNFLICQESNLNVPIALEGAYWALQYQHGSRETVAAQQQALEALKKGWATSFGKQNGEFKKKITINRRDCAAS